MSADELGRNQPQPPPALPSITRWRDGFELVVPARGEWAQDGFTSGSVILSADEINPRIIERHLRVLG